MTACRIRLISVVTGSCDCRVDVTNSSDLRFVSCDKSTKDPYLGLKFATRLERQKVSETRDNGSAKNS
jgi:hypothetical protein